MNQPGTMGMQIEHFDFVQFLRLKLLVICISHPRCRDAILETEWEVDDLSEGKLAARIGKTAQTEVGDPFDHRIIDLVCRGQGAAVEEGNLYFAIRLFLNFFAPGLDHYHCAGSGAGKKFA